MQQVYRPFTFGSPADRRFREVSRWPPSSNCWRTKEIQGQFRESVSDLDLRRVANPLEEMNAGERQEPACRLELLRGQNAVAIAPDDQRRAQMLSGISHQLSSPFRFDPPDGAQRSGGLMPNRTGIGLARELQRVLDPLLGRQRLVDVEESFRHPGTEPGGVARDDATDHRSGHQPQHRMHFGTKSAAIGQYQGGDPVRM